ncbi:MAG TPA: chromosomal replication initiator protein DnaA [Candidatus Dormibacteraeota bacterium]|nr:chromosomal replication initiator protein DnaA [Candidatus Dormibacteraeota bacterium]
MQESSSENIWQAAQEEWKFQIAKPSYEAWLKSANLLSLDGRKFHIGVPTKLAKDWLEDRYSAVIKETLSAIMAGDVEVTFEVTSQALHTEEAGDLQDAAEADSPVLEEPDYDPASSQLNPKFVFDNFVVGHNSRFAHAAARAVADAPGDAYNPLFLYGGVGLGKTHLMHAIGHAVMKKSRKRKVAYVTSERFMNEMIESIRRNQMNEFRKRYRNCDVLLIDDIQFLAGKDRTQEEFFHTFNALQEFNRHIVISSDRPPKDIPTLEERLRSRFEGGLIADIEPPDFETRVAILKSKAGPHNRLIPEDVLSFIAHKIQRNIRELEGALIRVLAYASVTHQPMTTETAARVLEDIIPSSETRTLSIESIKRVVANFYGITVDEMIGKRRDRHIVFPRQVAMFIIREETASSLPAIGHAFGGRDHTTVLHSYEKIHQDCDDDPRVSTEITKIRELLYQ